MAILKVFQNSIFDSDLFQAQTIGKTFQSNIFDSDIFQQIPTLTNIDNVFQTDIFQKVYGGKLLFQKQYTISTSGEIAKVFQSSIFDSDLFQTTSFTPSIYPKKVFQTNVFQNILFQTKQLANAGKYIFQSGLFQADVFDVPNLIKITIQEIMSVIEVQPEKVMGFVNTYNDDAIDILMSIYKVMGKTKTAGLDSISATELMYHTRARKNHIQEILDLSEFISFSKKTDNTNVEKV